MSPLAAAAPQSETRETVALDPEAARRVLRIRLLRDLVANGLYRVPKKKIATLHRMNVGTITSEATMRIRYASGRAIGTIEEDFIATLRRGDRFAFGGKLLEFVSAHGMEAVVRPSTLEVDGLAAPGGALGVGVVDLEARLEERVRPVDRRVL